MVYVVVVFSVMMMVMFVGVCGASASLERRKEVRELTSEEWDRFAGAVNEFRLSGRWEKIANLHTDPKVWQVAHSDESGLQAAFLPWHRVFLRRMEGELQRIDPKVTMPYWNWALDSEDPAGSPVLSPDFFGGSGDPETSFCVTEGSFSDLSNETCVKRLIPRDSGGFLTLSNLKEVLVENPDYGRFVNTMENGLGLHGHLHMFLGGDMARVNSPKDPLFYAHHAFIDKLWWEWQMMHNELGSPAYKGNATAPLYPFEESASDVFSAEDMGYTYSDPLVRDPSDNSTLPRYLELGGEEDIVALGERVWRGLPNNVTALKAVVKTAPRPASKFYVAWHEMKSQAALGQAQPASPDLLAAEIDHVANILTEPRLRTRALDSVTRGLGIPVTKILEDAEIDSPEAGSPANLSCPNYDVCLSCPCEVTMYSTSFNEDLKNAIKTEVAFIRDDPWDEYLRLGGQEAAAEEMEALDGCDPEDPDDPLCAEQTVDAGVVEGEDSSSGGGSDGVVDPEVGGGEGGHGGNETKPSIAETMSNVFQKVEPLFDDPTRTTDDVETALLTDGVVFESSVEEALAKVQAMPTILPPLSSVAYDPNAEVVEEPVAAPKAEVVEEPVAEPNAEVEVGPVVLSGNGVEEPKAEVVEEPVPAVAVVQSKPGEVHVGEQDTVAAEQEKVRLEWGQARQEAEEARQKAEEARQKAEEKAREAQEKARQKAEEARQKAEERAREAQEKQEERRRQIDARLESMMASVTANMHRANMDNAAKLNELKTLEEQIKSSELMSQQRMDLELRLQGEQEAMLKRQIDRELEAVQVALRQAEREVEEFQAAAEEARRAAEEARRAAEEKQQELAETARKVVEEKKEKAGKKVEEARRKAQVRAREAREMVQQKVEEARQKAEEARLNSDKKAREAQEKARQKAEEARQKAEEFRLKAEERAREAQEKAQQKVEEARERAREAQEKARQKAEEARQKAEEARRKAEERVREARERARQKAEEARQKVEEAKRKAQEWAREAREKARQKAEEARQKVEERAREAKEKLQRRLTRRAEERAREKAERARQKAEEARQKAEEAVRGR